MNTEHTNHKKNVNMLKRAQSTFISDFMKSGQYDISSCLRKTQNVINYPMNAELTAVLHFHIRYYCQLSF